MQQNSKSDLAKLTELFLRKPTAGQKAWGIIHDFYHKLLTYMDEKGITQAQLAQQTGKSRAAISQMLNKNPNVSIRKLIEIAEVVGIDIRISSPQLDRISGNVIEETIELGTFSISELAQPDFNQDNIKPMADFINTIDQPFYPALSQVM
ncbi:MAG TPA: helix-turn-helix transcriptional regulator [bacterium]|nr:helix-turn-helix transcriptional regulator [bacterium]